MSIKTASIISSVVTALLVLVTVIVFGFGGIVLLNGFMNADVAVNTGFACLGITLILCPILAWVLAKAMISKFHWNNIFGSVCFGLCLNLLGTGLSFRQCSS
ncbi:MAG: hypothetical protein IPN58_13615 [Anaerolineales bacterium]|nr:hypothetical protein [Anaerolineales bacterium]